MPVTVRDIISVMEGWAPACYAIREDNPGLQVGDPSAEVKHVLVALDVTPAVVDEVLRAGAQMLVTHHPLIFTSIRSINTAEGQGRLLGKLINANIALYSAHTNLDVAVGGVEDLLAERVGIRTGDGRPGVLDCSGEDGLLKLVVFVPKGYEDRVREAIGAAGAGWIGKYSDCTFMTPGTGTFKPLEGAKPFLGEVGSIERAEEFRLETILPESKKASVLRAMFEAHPYEEVAFDLYPLKNEGTSRGFGRVGSLEKAATLGELASRLLKSLNAPYVRVYGDPLREVQIVATSAGSGGGNVAAAARAGAHALITGDVKYTQVLQAMSLGLSVIDVGHFASERPVVQAVVEHLNRAFGSVKAGFEARAAKSEWEPFTVITAVESPAAAPQGIYTAFVDGGSRGNPGPAGCAAVLLDPAGNTIMEEARYLGEATNNVAEYNALILAAESALARGARNLLIKTDSELMARQLSGEYRVKNAGLAELHDRASRLLRGLESWEVRHIPREENRRADEIVNRTIDVGTGAAGVRRGPGGGS